MFESYYTSLNKTIDEFRTTECQSHTALSFDNMESRFTKFDDKTELISRVCHELADQIEDELADTPIGGIENLGISGVTLNIEYTKTDEIDSEICILVEFSEETVVCWVVGSLGFWVSFDGPSPIFNASDNETV